METMPFFLVLVLFFIDQQRCLPLLRLKDRKNFSISFCVVNEGMGKRIVGCVSPSRKSCRIVLRRTEFMSPVRVQTTWTENKGREGDERTNERLHGTWQWFPIGAILLAWHKKKWRKRKNDTATTTNYSVYTWRRRRTAVQIMRCVLMCGCECEKPNR